MLQTTEFNLKMTSTVLLSDQWCGIIFKTGIPLVSWTYSMLYLQVLVVASCILLRCFTQVSSSTKWNTMLL